MMYDGIYEGNKEKGKPCVKLCASEAMAEYESELHCCTDCNYTISVSILEQYKSIFLVEPTLSNGRVITRKAVDISTNEWS